MELVRPGVNESDASETARAVMHAPVDKWTGADARPAKEALAVEEPLEIRLVYGPAHDRARKSISVTMRTPGYDYELAAGFLMTEGVIHDVLDIEKIVYAAEKAESAAPEERDLEPCQPRRNVVLVQLAPDVQVSLANLERNFYTTSSCGICGKASLLALRTVCPPRTKNTFSIDAEILYTLPARLREAQSVFDSTGGLHGAGLFNAHGKLLAMREDVGRHNAVDKLLGSQFLADRTPLTDCLLLLSGRASFELLQKAAMGGISMVAAIGAPSSLAVTVAREFDIILAGFLRDGHMNVYYGTDHIRRQAPVGNEEQS
jgi:FdhD protein